MRLPSRASRLLLLVAAATALTACASSGASSDGRVGGYFDGDQPQYESQGASDGGRSRAEYAPSAPTGGAYAPPPAPGAQPMPEPMNAPVHISSDESDSGGSIGRDLFDFAGEAIEGALRGPDKMAEAPREPPRPRDPSLPSVGEPVKGDKPPAESSASKRLVIYKGALVVLVPAVEAAVEKLAARTTELGGYVENQSGNSSSNNGTVTLRVPAEKFYALVNELGAYGQVTQKNVSASDVTKTVFDIELRLETAEKSRQRLLDLLKSANKMEEILQIENEVRRLTQEIEGMKGELRFIKDQVAFSTLAVTFYSNAPPPNQGPTRTRSRFDWINQVGVESVLYNF